MTTFNTAEVGLETAAPYELYKFARAGKAWHYTTRETSVSFGGDTYVPAVISREAITQNGEDQTMSVLFSLPRDNDLVAEFIGIVPPDPVAVFVYRNHQGLDASETKTIFLGEVSKVDITNSLAQISCSSLESAFTQPIGRVHVQPSCPWMLYEAQCGVSPTGFTHTGTVMSISTDGLTYVVGSMTTIDPDTTFYVRGTLSKDGQPRFIIAQSGAAGTYTFTLMTAFNPAPVVGDTVTATAGCDRTLAVCKNRFNNLLRFGGFPFLPGRSPWERIV